MKLKNESKYRNALCGSGVSNGTVETIVVSYSLGILSPVEQVYAHQLTFHEAFEIVEK